MRARRRGPGRGRIWVAAALLGMAAPAWTCPLQADDGQLLQDGGVQLAWRVEGDGGIVAGRDFVLTLRACPADAELLRVDAVMPAHRHGMNYRPGLTALGPGQWRVDGLIWHMSGVWELQFDLRRDGRTYRLSQALDLK